MLWAISCTDKPNTAAARAAVLQPHRDYLKSQKGILVLAGATQTDDGATALGSLFVVNVKTRGEAKPKKQKPALHVIENDNFFDPYTPDPMPVV